MNVLVVGPSSTKSKGGMATVIKEIEDDRDLCDKYNIESYESYIDGSRIKVLAYSIFAFIVFWFSKRKYSIYHIHAASRGSTFRKGYYVRAAKRWNKKVILHIHGAQYMEFYKESNNKNKQKIINILNTADVVLALSEEWKRKFESTFGIKNCVVLENGINTENLETATSEPSLYQHSFVTLGRLGKRKGTYDLLDAIELAKASVQDIKFLFAGDGEIEQVKKIIRERHLENNIEVVGWANYDKKIELLSRVSTVVLPSYNEGLPMSILEGMACGKAIISTTVGAIPEVVKKENGILVQAGDVKALSEAIVKCCTDSEMLTEMSSKNINKIANEFSMKKMHSKLASIYESQY